MTLTDQILDAVSTGTYHDPHAVLGIHPDTHAEGTATWIIRARRPLARSVTAVFAGGTSANRAIGSALSTQSPLRARSSNL